MNGKDAIINKIISDSENLAKAILEEAEIKVSSLINAANTMADDYVNKITPQVEAEKKAIVKRLESVAKIEVKKNTLAARQQMIDAAFDKAEEKITGFSKPEYLKFIRYLIERYSEDGDTVVISKKDRDKITAKFIGEIAADKKISLKLSDTEGDFSGGIILSSKGYDKNLTLKALLRGIKEKHIADISKILFGQVK